MKPNGRARIASSLAIETSASKIPAIHLTDRARRPVGDRRRLEPDQQIHLSKNPADCAGLRLTLKEQKRNIIPIATSHRE
jgi:hypothetical protein